MASKNKKSGVTVIGKWFPMPIGFLNSRAWAELSPHAAKMLLDLCAGLGANAYGNGDLSAAPAVMKPKGWSSNATREAALKELERANLLCMTRQGSKRVCSLYAVTLWPMQCDLEKLDYGPGAYTTLDWQQHGAADSPTPELPAKWRSLRRIELGSPATGEGDRVLTPQRGKVHPRKLPFNPVAGSKDPISAPSLTPLRGTYLDMPSARQASSPLGKPVPTVRPAAIRKLVARIASQGRGRRRWLVRVTEAQRVRAAGSAT